MGGGQHATIIDAASMDRVFVVTAGASLTLSDLTIQHGLALVAGTGGGVLAISGPTTLNMSTSRFATTTRVQSAVGSPSDSG